MGSIESVFILFFIVFIFFAIAVLTLIFLIIRKVLNSARNTRSPNAIAHHHQFGGSGLEPGVPASPDWFGGASHSGYASSVAAYDGSDLAPQAPGGWESAGGVDSNTDNSGGFTDFGGGGDFGGSGAGGDFGGGGSDFSSGDSGGGSTSSD